jgi:hypothetical protein
MKRKFGSLLCTLRIFYLSGLKVRWIVDVVLEIWIILLLKRVAGVLLLDKYKKATMLTTFKGNTKVVVTSNSLVKMKRDVMDVLWGIKSGKERN